MALDSETSVSFTGRGESSSFSSFVLWVADPVDSGVVSNGVVGWIYDDDFVIFVGSVLSDPVAVKDSEGGEFVSDSQLSLGSKVSGGLQLVDTD